AADAGAAAAGVARGAGVPVVAGVGVVGVRAAGGGIAAVAGADVAVVAVGGRAADAGAAAAGVARGAGVAVVAGVGVVGVRAAGGGIAAVGGADVAVVAVVGRAADAGAAAAGVVRRAGVAVVAGLPVQVCEGAQALAHVVGVEQVWIAEVVRTHRVGRAGLYGVGQGRIRVRHVRLVHVVRVRLQRRVAGRGDEVRRAAVLERHGVGRDAGRVTATRDGTADAGHPAGRRHVVRHAVGGGDRDRAPLEGARGAR